MHRCNPDWDMATSNAGVPALDFSNLLVLEIWAPATCEQFAIPHFKMKLFHVSHIPYSDREEDEVTQDEHPS